MCCDTLSRMTDDDHLQADRETVLGFLAYQRTSVLAVVDGLTEEAWQTSVVPSGWTPAGLVQHLGDAERHWFQDVVAAVPDDLPWDEGRPPYDPGAPFTCSRPAAEVVAYYREQCARSDEILRVTPLSSPPRGRHGEPELDDQIHDVLWVVLHLIEETACHSGHLDIARELLDGGTNLGLR